MKTTKTIIIVILFAAGLLAGCGDKKTDQALSYIDTLMSHQPDSALHMLDSLMVEKPHWVRSQRMRYDLLRLKAENKAYVPFSSDSIAQALVSYYNFWGNANERMMANYLLGCVYRDLGDSPRAIDAYQTAISKADTTNSNCDFYTLSCIYAQIAEIYHKQLLFSNELIARSSSNHFADIVNDTLQTILNISKSASAYILLNKKDSAEILLERAKQLYLKTSFVQEVWQSSTILMYMYVQDSDKLSEAKRLMDEYEQNSYLFNKHHELTGPRRLYYYYKGQYHEGINNLDSAEYYYRKVLYPNMPFTALNSMYKGLLSVYTKRHETDSIAKYARLYCEVNDSSIAKKDQELTAQMAANYNYGLYQKEALKSESKARRAQLMTFAIIIVTLITSIILYYQWRTHKKKLKEEKIRRQKEIEDLKEKYATAVDEYSNNIQTLQLLENTHKETISIIQQELDKAKGDNNTYRQKLSEINTIYESNRQELLKENESLKKKIEELKRQEGFRQQLTNSCNFADTDIMKRVGYLIEHPLVGMAEKESEQLVLTASTYYPALLHDLNNSPRISQQEIRACILISQALRESDIAHLLNTSAQRITNIKATLNKELFGQNSARTFYKNLVKRYEIYII